MGENIIKSEQTKASQYQRENSTFYESDDSVIEIDSDEYSTSKEKSSSPRSDQEQRINNQTNPLLFTLLTEPTDSNSSKDSVHKNNHQLKRSTIDSNDLENENFQPSNKNINLSEMLTSCKKRLGISNANYSDDVTPKKLNVSDSNLNSSTKPLEKINTLQNINESDYSLIKIKNLRLIKKNRELEAKLAELTKEKEIETTTMASQQKVLESENKKLKNDLVQQKQRNLSFIKKQIEETTGRFNEILVKAKLDLKILERKSFDDKQNSSQQIESLNKNIKNFDLKVKELQERIQILDDENSTLRRIKSNLEQQIRTLKLNPVHASDTEEVNRLKKLLKTREEMIETLRKSWKQLINEQI